MNKNLILTDILNARIILDVIRGVAEDMQRPNIAENLNKIDVILTDAFRYIQDTEAGNERL